MAEAFKFQECVPIVKLTGRNASDIVEFVEILKSVSIGSIFYHMHQYFLKPHIVAPDYPNDFALWAASALEDKVLAEKFANLNPYEFSKIEDVRAELIRIVDAHLMECSAPRPVIRGKEFFFNEAVTIVIPTGLTASNLEEFRDALQKVDRSSLYFHFYEARLRLENEFDDFSRFFSDCPELGCLKLAEKIKRLDPYMYSTDVLREKLLFILERELQRK
ncbi:MAG: hypothetical protein KAT46_01290 [Deltaproteobacteria bacterium]|nr:hypothetical protein [Deltaproteobacteria bacterium]